MPLGQSELSIGTEYPAVALLRKEREARTFPFPRRTYPMSSVTGIPSAV